MRAKAAERKFKFQYFMKRNHQVVGWMTRGDWEKLRVCTEEPVEIRPELTPLAGAAQQASFLALAAARLPHAACRVSLYRYHDADQPTPVNVDTYLVYENILGRPDYGSLMVAATTSDSPPLREYLGTHVAFVAESPSTSHWLSVTDSPAYVQVSVQNLTGLSLK